jgi:nucleotide-binding universal stress UspA family protein
VRRPLVVLPSPYFSQARQVRRWSHPGRTAQDSARIRYMKILLAIDGSAFSDRAIQAVVAQAGPHDARVQVLHVVYPLANLSVYSSFGTTPEIEKFEQERLAQADEVVQQAAKTLRAVGFDVSVRVESGEPKSMILEAAAAWKADLIVVGSHGRSGVDRFLLGSVSEAIARHGSCSVQIVRDGSTQDRSKKCGHPPCTCTPKSGKYCSAQCEAMETMPDIDCRCGHPECKGKAH